MNEEMGGRLSAMVIRRGKFNASQFLLVEIEKDEYL
jgi:hypothetical protein